MDAFRIRTAALIVATALIGLGVGLGIGLFEDDDPAPPGASPAADEEVTPEESEERPEGDGRDDSGGPELPREEDDPQGLDPGPSGPAPASSDEVAAARAARAYVAAINNRKGGKVCDAFASGALRSFELPERRGSCAASFNASFGFRDNRGQPIWSSSEMTQDVSAAVGDDSARVVATVFTEYADVREPTIEDDIIYLTRSQDRWLVVKPSATLYRAIGTADVPIEALEPPA